MSASKRYNDTHSPGIFFAYLSIDPAIRSNRYLRALIDVKQTMNA